MTELARKEALQAIRTVIKIHDQAMEMNRDYGFEIFDKDSPEAFLGALEAQDPPFTVVKIIPKEVIPIRKLVVAWFHDSEEICEHDILPPSCEIMADHLLRAFNVSIKDWKAYTEDNRKGALAPSAASETSPQG